MSTNYYATTKNAEFMFDKMPGAIIDYENKRFEIHLAQFVHYATPLLQTNAMFSTWKELAAYLKNNEDHVRIFSEFETEYSVCEFIKMMEERNKEGRSRMQTFPRMKHNSSYYTDEDGYEWCKVDFV